MVMNIHEYKKQLLSELIEHLEKNSITEMSKRSGINKGTLLKIRNGASVPTVETIYDYMIMLDIIQGGYD